MKVTNPVSNQILKVLRRRMGESVSIADMLVLGPRSRVEKSLSRLVSSGSIRRIGRGLYEYPRMSTLLSMPAQQSPDSLVRAWAKKNALRVVPSGAYAANALGLSTQVPSKLVFYTNGRTRTIRLGPYTIRVLNRGPKTMDVSGKVFPMLLQALRFLGKTGVTQDTVSKLGLVLDKAGRREILSNLRYAPAWMTPTLLHLAAGETPTHG